MQREENLFENPKYFILPEEKAGNVKMQIISSGPDSELQSIRDNYLRLIHKAKKSIYIQTPYFIPDESIQTALLMATMSGVEVNLMFPVQAGPSICVLGDTFLCRRADHGRGKLLHL